MKELIMIVGTEGPTVSRIERALSHSEEGFEIVTARTISHALNLVTEGACTPEMVIITNISFGGMQADEFAWQLRVRRSLGNDQRATAIVVLYYNGQHPSGGFFPRIQARFFPKPFIDPDFLCMVRGTLKERAGLPPAKRIVFPAVPAMAAAVA